jgi:Putative quorum-sensing-regulated virulence factor
VLLGLEDLLPCFWYCTDRRPPAPIMPWGRYQGRTLAELPADYLRWIVFESTAASADRRLYQAAFTELERRRSR